MDDPKDSKGETDMTEFKVVGGTTLQGVRTFTDADRAVPGLNWSLPPETDKAIREIEDSIRASEQKSGFVLIG